MSFNSRLDRLEKEAARAKALQASEAAESELRLKTFDHGCGHVFDCAKCGQRVAANEPSGLIVTDGDRCELCDACYTQWLEMMGSCWQKRIKQTYALYGEVPPAIGSKLSAKTKQRLDAHPEIGEAMAAELAACESLADEERLTSAWAQEAAPNGR